MEKIRSSKELNVEKVLELKGCLVSIMPELGQLTVACFNGTIKELDIEMIRNIIKYLDVLDNANCKEIRTINNAIYDLIEIGNLLTKETNPTVKKSMENSIAELHTIAVSTICSIQ